jgi:PAS domain S-box-containing protein
MNYLQSSNINQWKVFIARYLEEKNRTLYNTFFENIDSIDGFRRLNYYYLANLLDVDSTLKDFKFAGMIIYNMNGDIIFSYRKNPENQMLTDEVVTEKMSSSLVLNDVTIHNIKSHGTHLSVACAPLLTRTSKHFVSIVYFFDIDHLIVKKLSLNPITISGIVIFCLIVLSILMLAFTYLNYIKNMTNFVGYCISEKGSVNHYKLWYIKPFNLLEQKISFLVSQRKEVEKNYLEISEKFYYLVRLTTEGIVMEDKHGFIYYCNQRFAQILGYKDDSEIIGLKFTDLFISNTEVEKYQDEIKLRKMKVNYTYKIALRDKAGNKKICQLTATIMQNNDGEVQGYYGTITDVSGVITMSQEQAFISQLRSLVISSNPNPIVILDENDYIVDANDSFINYVNKRRNDVITNSFETAIKGLEIDKAYTRESDEIEFYEPSQNQWYFVSIKPLLSEGNEYKLVFFHIIGHLKSQLQYHKLIFDDFRGFFFIVNKKNNILYLSPSFYKISSQSDAWFKSYYASLINLSPTKALNLFEPMIIIAQNRVKLEFKITQLYTNNTNLFLYQATQK